MVSNFGLSLVSICGRKKMDENYKNKLATCPKNKYEIYQCQKSAFLNSTETSE
ncbi:hypothetical protein COSHB9_04610 [Companilactobacillus alimentarius]